MRRLNARPVSGLQLKRSRTANAKLRKRATFSAVAVLCVVGLVGVLPSVVGGKGADPAPSAILQTAASGGPMSVKFTMCASKRYTCVVDGDTIWLEGRNLRLRFFDTPEPYTAICGGPQEVALAKRASARLLELLNSNPFTVETFGLDATRRRTLATIRIDGHDVGDILIQERLARKWPDGEEWWCT